MRGDSENVSFQDTGAAERRVEIATAKLAVAESYRFYVGIAVGLMAWKVFDLNGWIAFAIAVAAFFYSDYSYSKEYDSADDELARLTRTGKYYGLRKSEGEASDS